MAASQEEPREADLEGRARGGSARRALWDRLAGTIGPRVSLGLALLSSILVVAALRASAPASSARPQPGEPSGRADVARRRLAAVREGLADLNVSRNATTERRLFGFGIARINDRFVETPTCVIDVEQAGLQLVEAGATVRNAVRVCRRTDTEERKMLCASVIADIIAFVGYGAEFLEGSAQQCADHLVSGDLCAESITELFAGLAQVVQASTGIKAVCMNLTRHELYMRHKELVGADQDPVLLLAGADGRRLSGGELGRREGRRRSVERGGLRGSAVEAAEDIVADARRAKRRFKVDQRIKEASRDAAQRIRERRRERTIAQELEEIAAQAALNNSRQDQRMANTFQCVLHASDAAEFVARAGDIISASVLDCAPVNKNGPEGEQACELDVVGIIESFTMAANSIARTIFRCPTIVNICAECAASIINVIAATEALVNAVSGLSLCVKPERDAFVEHETHLLPPAVYLPPPPSPPPGEGPAPPESTEAYAPGGYGGFGGYFGGYRRDPGVLPPPQWQQVAQGQRPVARSQAYAPGGGVGGAYAEPQAGGESYGPEP